MAQKALSFEAGHAEMIHDAQLDYYGQRLATASSDRTINVFDVAGEQQTLLSTLKGHDGPVWQVAWGHPKFGSLLASCSYDGRVVVWKEGANNQWAKVYEYQEQEGASVNAIAWAPHAYGLLLAAATATGNVVIISRVEDRWECQEVPAHNGSCNSVSWGPDMGSSMVGPPAALPARRFVTGGCDHTIKMWTEDAQQGWKELEGVFEQQHGDWVRDVAWAPSLGLLSNTIASCSEDKMLIIWSEGKNGAWTQVLKKQYDVKVWRVSWSVMGNILAVAQGDNKVTLMKQQIDGTWADISTVTEADQ